jgi:hypothetical protein
MSTVLMVLTNSAEGQDAEFNAWYDEIHLPEVLPDRIDQSTIGTWAFDQITQRSAALTA